MATAIPVSTGCPVTMGFITRAMTSTSMNPAARYIMSCFSMEINVHLDFPCINITVKSQEQKRMFMNRNRKNSAKY